MKKLILLACVACMVAPMAFSQDYDDNPGISEQGIKLGKFLFTPTLELLLEDKDNIFLKPHDKVHDQIYIARARLMLEYPFLQNYFRITWGPEWREYADTEINENFSHYLDLTASFDTASGMELDLVHHFLQGAFEVHEIDPGGELVYGDEAFNKNDTIADFKYFFSPRNGIGLHGKFITLSYDDPSTLWYDYTTYEAGITYQRYMNPLLRMALGAEILNFDADETLCVDCPSRVRDNDGMNIFVKFYGAFSPTITADLKVGYETLDYDRSGYYGEDTYEDWSMDSSLTWQLTEGQNLVFRAYHNPQPSNYERTLNETGDKVFGTYFTHSKLSVKYNIRLANQSFLAFGGSVFNNDYNEITTNPNLTWLVSRSDDALKLDAEFGYHFTPGISARLNYSYMERDSNMNHLDYDVNIWMVNLVFGY